MTSNLRELMVYYKAVVESNCDHDWYLSENSSGVIFLSCRKCFLSKIVRDAEKKVSE